MKKIFRIFLIAVLLCGCGTTVDRRDSNNPYCFVPGNAEGFSGIGQIRIGKSIDEIEPLLSYASEDIHYNIGTHVVDISTGEYPELKQITGYYKFSDQENLFLTLSFFRDTLIYIKPSNKSLVKEALVVKYGEGWAAKNSKSMEEKYWKGDVATARYVRNDYYRLEYIEIRPTHRDIDTEIEEYMKPIQAKSDSLRKESLKVGI